MSYEVGLHRTVRAFHVMPGMAGPEGQRHHHDYRIEVVVTRQELDTQGMVCDLDVLDDALAGLTARIDGKDLEDAIQPAGGQPVTVEVFARWAHETLADVAAKAGGETLGLRVWETPVAFGGYRAATGG